MRQLLRWAGLVVLVAGAVVGTTSADVGAQSAGNGLEEQSVNSFDFDPSRGVVRVTIDITLRNVTTDRVDGNIVSRTFFDTYAVAVPLGAENIVATLDGSILDGNLVSDPEFPAFSTYRFRLATQLFSGQSASVQVTYDHLGAPPRDPVPWRVNEAYAGFVAFGLGDDGLVTVRISQPDGYEFDDSTDLAGFEATAPDAFGTVIHTRGGLDATSRVNVSLADDDRLVPRSLEVTGADVQLRAWPDDPEWAEFTAATVEVGIPTLADLIGSPWPIEERLNVRETVQPNLRGYAGWFDRETNEIAVGEALDADTIYHELSHAWFNSAVTTERWFTEGLAQVYAAELVRRDGGEARVPTEPPTDAPGGVPLTDWTSNADESDRETEEYGYASSFWVVDVLVDEIGFDRSREVIDALHRGASPYDGTVTGERPAQAWQRVYDTVVEVGGAATAPDVFRTFVVDPQGAGLIDTRDRAAADVADLARRSTPWSLPLGVRNRLERWELDAVAEALTTADELLARRVDLEAIETDVGIDEPDLAATAYADAPMGAEVAVDFSEASAILDGQLDLGERLTDRLTLIDERSGPAEVHPPEIASIIGVDDFAAALDAADRQLLAMEQIIDAEHRLDSTSGVLEQIGQWGSDLDGDLDEARSLLEAGDTHAALALLDAVDDRIDDLPLIGARRLAILGAVLGVVIAVVILFVRRSRRAEPDLSPEPPV